MARLCENKYRHKKFDNNAQGFAAFLNWLNGFGDPSKIHAYAKSELSRAKTDKADAKLIARYGLGMQPDLWTPPPRAIRELQALLRRVEHLLAMQQMERNRLDTANPAMIDSSKPSWIRWRRSWMKRANAFNALSIAIPTSGNDGTASSRSQASDPRLRLIC